MDDRPDETTLPPWPPELDTLEQLTGGDMHLTVIRRIYSSDDRFAQAIHRLLQAGDVKLLSNDGGEVPRWQWRELFVDGQVFSQLADFQLSLTRRGVDRVL